MSTSTKVVIGVAIVAAIGILWLVARRSAPAPLLDDAGVAGAAGALAREPSEAARIVGGIGAGVTAIGTSIAEAMA